MHVSSWGDRIRIGRTTAKRMATLFAAFAPHPDGAGPVRRRSDPIDRGHANYNSTYGMSFAGNGYASGPSHPHPRATASADHEHHGGDRSHFETLAGKLLSIPVSPKALDDELNSAVVR